MEYKVVNLDDGKSRGEIRANSLKAHRLREQNVSSPGTRARAARMQKSRKKPERMGIL